MMRKENKIGKQVSRSIVFLFLLFILISFYQHGALAKDFGEEKDELKELIRRGEIMNKVFVQALGYAVLRDDNLSLCDSIGESSGNCRELAMNLWYLKIFAQSKCEDEEAIVKRYNELFLSNGKTLKDRPEYNDRIFFCQHKDDCNSQTGAGMKDVCNGFKLGNALLIMRGEDEFYSRLNTGDRPLSQEKAIERLGLYKGFESGGNQEACERFTAALHGEQAYVCEVLFSKDQVNDILDSVAEDLAYFLLSDKYEAKRFCNKIKNINVRDGCLSSDAKAYFWL